MTYLPQPGGGSTTVGGVATADGFVRPADGSIPSAAADVGSSLASWLATLPTDSPAPTAGWWNNGGLPTYFPGASA